MKNKCILKDCEKWQIDLNNSFNQILNHQRNKINSLKYKKKKKYKNDCKNHVLKLENMIEIHEDNNFDGLVLPYVVGLDISFIKDNNEDACVGVVVINLPDLEVMYEDVSMVKITAPYVSGYLAFREAEFYVEKVKSFMNAHPNMKPITLMVDGNGILHKKNFGLACHIGVMLDLPSIGVAKKLYNVDGIEKNECFRKKIEEMDKFGDSIRLESSNGDVLGIALRSGTDSSNPIYISPGHKITLETAVNVVKLCCQYRIPEPVRLADIKSREFLREKFK